MSVFSVTALDRLIESDRRSSSSSDMTLPIEKQDLGITGAERRPLYVSYPYNSSTTSGSTSPHPRKPSPSSFSPSPYVVNHKRRVPNCVNSSKLTSQQNGFHVSEKNSVSRPSESLKENRSHDTTNLNGNELVEPFLKEHSRSPQSSLTSQFQCKNGDSTCDDKSQGQRKHSLDNCSNGSRSSATEEHGIGNRVSGADKKKMTLSKNNDDPRGKKKSEEDTRAPGPSNASSSCVNDTGDVSRLGHNSHTSIGSSSEEWFDAPDAPLPEYSSDDDCRRLSWSDTGASLRGKSDSSVVLQLKAEIQRRIAAEEAREAMLQQRDGMAYMLSSAGISLPQSELGSEYDKLMGFSDSESQRLVIARYVAAAVTKGAVRAEAELELLNVLAEKSKENARLKDKLQYYELVNHEMSHRNQESIENARQTRRRRQRRTRFVLLGLSAAVCVGFSVAFAYKYAPWQHVKSLRSGSTLPEGELPNPKSLEKVVELAESSP